MNKRSLLIVARLNTELGHVLQNADVKNRFAAEAAEIAGGMPRDLAQYLKADYDKWGEVIRAAPISGE